MIDSALKDETLRRLYAGTYNYNTVRNTGESEIYAQEKFTAFSLPLTYSKIMESEVIARLSTGELFTIQVYHLTNAEGFPKETRIIRKLGKNSSTELFEYSSSNSRISYTFFEQETIKSKDVLVFNNRSYIITPGLINSVPFLQYRKNKANSSYIHNIISSSNNMIFSKMPLLKQILVYRPDDTPESIDLGGIESQGDYYYLRKTPESTGINNTAKVFISKHLNIPILLEYENIYIALDHIEEFQE